VLHSFSSSIVLTILWRKKTTNATFVVVFYPFYETKVKDNNERALSLSSVFFLALHKTMTSLPTHHYLLQLKKKNKNLEEGDEPSSSSSSSTTKEKKP
jgi:hypothetical protein